MSGVGEHVSPPTMDRDSAPWWEALRRHELVMQRCEQCRTWRWPPRAMCSRCGSFAVAWEPVSGQGRVASWIVNHHRFGPGQEPPYVVVTVRLAEQDDLLLVGSLEGDGIPSVGAPVTAVFVDQAPDGPEPFTLLSWRLTD